MHICVYLCSCTLHSAQFPSSELLWLLSSADIDSCGRGHILPLPHYIWHLSNLYGKCHNLPSVRSVGYCLPFVCYLHANQLLPSSSSTCLVSSTAVTSVSSVAAISTYCPYWSMSFPLLLSRSFLFYLNVFFCCCPAVEGNLFPIDTVAWLLPLAPNRSTISRVCVFIQLLTNHCIVFIFSPFLFLLLLER